MVEFLQSATGRPSSGRDAYPSEHHSTRSHCSTRGVCRVPGVDVRLYWKHRQAVVCTPGMELVPTSTLDHKSPIDLLFVPADRDKSI